MSRMEGILVTEETFDRRALDLPPLEEESLPSEGGAHSRWSLSHDALIGDTTSLTEN